MTKSNEIPTSISTTKTIETPMPTTTKIEILLQVLSTTHAIKKKFGIKNFKYKKCLCHYDKKFSQ